MRLDWILFVALLSSFTLGCGARNAPSSNTVPSSSSATLVLDPPPGEAATRLATAVEKMDAGDLVGAEKLLTELHAQFPENAIVLHELALCYRMEKKPERAVALLSPFADRLPVSTLASLASALDEGGKHAEAEALLRRSLEKHPDSGLLHSELGTTLARRGNTEEALKLYLKGSEVEPNVPANHFNLATLLSTTRARGLTLIYGETLRILEPATPRSREVATLMVRVLHDGVKITKSEGEEFEATVSLAPDMTADEVQHPPLPNAFELAFGTGLVFAHRAGLSLASLHKARTDFLDAIQTSKIPFDWNSVPLFVWLKKLRSAGHLEAYDYWLLGPAFPDAAESYAKSHQRELEEMAKYVAETPLFPAR